MSNSTLEDRLQDPKFKHWVMCALALDIATPAVRDFVEKKNLEIYKSVLQGNSRECSACPFRKTLNCPKNSCNMLEDAIKKIHRYNNPSFKNTNVKDCMFIPWELAKCFMPLSGYEGITTAQDTDLTGILSVIINNIDFQQYVTENLSQDTNIFCEVKKVRNKIMHKPNFEFERQKFDTYKDKILQMLQNIPATDDRKLAITKINELANGTMTITTGDVCTAVKEAISSLKLMEIDIRERVTKMSDQWEKTLEKKTKEGEEILQNKISKGIEDIEGSVDKGKAEIQSQTDMGKRSIIQKKEEVFESIIRRKDNVTGQLSLIRKEGLHQFRHAEDEVQNRIRELQTAGKQEVEDQTQAAKEKIQSQRIKAEEELERRRIATERENERLQEILKRGHKDLERLQEKQDEAKNISEELAGSAELIIQRREEGTKKLSTVTQRCMEMICDETKRYTEVISEKSQSEQKRLEEEVTSFIQAKLGELHGPLGTIQRDLRNALICQENIFPFHHLYVQNPPNKRCSNTGIAVMDSGRIAVADNGARSVRVVDVKVNVIISELKLSSPPWDITNVAPNKLAVTCGDTIQLLHLEDTLSVDRILKLDGPCYGIQYSDFKFFVSVGGNQPAVKVINMDGTIIKSFTQDVNGQALFKVPLHITLSTDKTKLFVSDSEGDKVVSLELGGNQQHSVYKNDKLRSPFGVVVDRNDNVFVAGRLSHNVHQITKQCELVQILLDDSKGMNSPQSMAYCETEHKLYITHGGYPLNNTATIFQLK